MMLSPAMILDPLLPAFAASAVFYVPGCAWSWLLRPTTLLDRVAAAALLSLPLILLPAVVLAEAGHLHLAALVAWAVSATLAGAIFERRIAMRTSIRAPGSGASDYRAMSIGFLLLWAAFAALLAWPNRGEWLRGGWDPGVNVNQGLLLARTGRVAQPPAPVIAEAMTAAPGAFSRECFGLTEAFPGLPLDPATGALRPYFYRATPAFIAVLDLLAGRSAAWRANHLAGLMTVMIFLGLLGRAFAALSAPRRRATALLGALALAAQPVFLAYLSNPASEMLELALACGVGFLLLQPRSVPAAVALGATLLLACLNRVSFLFHHALLLSILTLWDAGDEQRSTVHIRHLCVAASLILGLAWYTWVTPESLVKVRHLLPALHGALACAVLLALLVDGLLLFRGRGAPAGTRALAMVPLLALIAFELRRHDAWLEFLRNLPAWQSYAGVGLLIAAPLGLLLAARRSGAAPWLLWLATGLVAVLIHRHAAELYPWATKRWLAFSPPLLATGAAALAAGLAARFGRAGLALGGLLVLMSLVPQAPRAREAWSNTEYNGTAAALDRLVAQLRPDDLIVADHFTWGTPLSLAYGFRVLNAEPLLAGEGRPGEVAAFLRKQVARGTRVVLLTSTRAGLAAWPAPLRQARPCGPPVDVAARELVQHRGHRAFTLRDTAAHLQAAAWDPGQP